LTRRARVAADGHGNVWGVGALARLWPGIGQADLTAAATLVGPQVGIKSPWAPPSHLATVVWSDIFGKLEVAPLSRAEAMRVPAVARARHIICSTIARDPMHFYRGTEQLPDDRWLNSTAGTMSAFHRDTMTADDLFFYGWSCWRRHNSTPDDAGRVWPLHVERIPMEQWQLEPDTGRVLIYKPNPVQPGTVSLQAARADEIILIPGPHEGLLVDGADSIRHAADLHRAANKAAKHPSAYLALSSQPGAAPLKRRSDDTAEVTVETIVRDWHAAREGENGGVAYLGGLTASELGTFSEHLVVEGRNAAAVDIARHASIPADLIDATVAAASLQYSTSKDNDRRAIDYGTGFYMGAFSARLSLDDVCPRGQRVAFELEEWLKTDAPAPGRTPTAPAPGRVPVSAPTPGVLPA
jgi:hypothetical protein